MDVCQNKYGCEKQMLGVVRPYTQKEGLHERIMKMSDSNSNIHARRLGYIFLNLTYWCTLTTIYYLFLTFYNQFNERCKYKQKMLSLMIHECYEGSDHCGKKLHNTGYAFFLQCHYIYIPFDPHYMCIVFK